MQSYGVAAARYDLIRYKYPDAPESPRAALRVGWAELRLGHRERARAAWTGVGDTFPSDAGAPLALVLAAELANRAGDTTGSRQLLDRIIRQYPTSPYAGIARLTRSAFALRQQQEAEALRDLEEVIQVNGPSAIEERRKLGLALATPGAEIGVESVPTGNGAQPHEGEGGLVRFATLFLNGRQEPVPYTLHGLVLLAAADRGWADVLTGKLASRLVEEFPSYPPAPAILTRVAAAAAASGQWPVARHAYETLMARAPAAGATRTVRVPFAEALFRTGSVAEAQAIAQSAATAGDEAPGALLLLAEIHETAGERRAALTAYDRLLKEHPRVDRSPGSLLAHVRLLEELGQGSRVTPILSRLVEMSSGEVAAEAAYRLGHARRAEGQHAAAVEWYLSAAYVAEGSRWARVALLEAGRSLTALDETKEALAVYRKLLPARPGIDPPADREVSGEASYRAGEILAGAGLHKEALDMFVASAHFTAGLPIERRALVGVVQCLVATGDRPAAEAVYRRLLGSGATEPDLLAQARTALGATSQGGGRLPPDRSGNRASAQPAAAR